MIYQILADFVVFLHLAFIIFAVAGGFLLFRWRRCAWIHLPAVLWAALNAFAGLVCPLTPLENWLREKGGEIGYQSSFIEHYILPVIYPAELTRGFQVVLGFLVSGINIGFYACLLRRSAKKKA